MNSQMATRPATSYREFDANPPAGVIVPLSVFVVEDSPAVRDIMLEQLRDLPNVICTGHADTEASAIDDLQHVDCDILILDIKLKSGTGIGVLRAVASGLLHPPRTRIIFSNYTDSAFRTLASSLGATHFFDKTRDFPALLSLISTLASPAH